MLFVRAYPRETQEMVFDAHECGIRVNAATDSEGKRPPNPIEGGHRFRSKAATVLIG
jgi:hypothetical protein